MKKVLGNTAGTVIYSTATLAPPSAPSTFFSSFFFLFELLAYYS
jgi:hypothetical protein